MFVEHLSTGMQGVHKLMASIIQDRSPANSGMRGPWGHSGHGGRLPGCTAQLCPPLSVCVQSHPTFRLWKGPGDQGCSIQGLCPGRLVLGGEDFLSKGLRTGFFRFLVGLAIPMSSDE